jgi:hypothetical protein
MNRPGAKPAAQKDKSVKEPVKKTTEADTPQESNQDNAQNAAENINPEKLQIADEIADLLSKDDIIAAIKKFKPDSEEKTIVVEFVNSHIEFLNQIVGSDYKKGINRADVEIRDLISNVNMMLQSKDDYLFTSIVAHSPSHYRNIQKKYYANIKKEEGKK